MSNTTQTTSQTSAWRSRGLPIALLLSLVMNIGLIGYLAGRWASPNATPHMPPPSIGMGRFLRGLDENRRDELKPYLSAHFDSLRPSIRANRKAHQAVRTAIGAEPFVPAALEQALFTLNSNRGAGAQAQASTLTKLVDQLSSDERTQLASSLMRRRGFGGRPMRERQHHNRHSRQGAMPIEQSPSN